MVYLGCASATKAVTFVNSIRLPPDAPPRVLVQGDTLGFGGNTLSAPGDGTISYSVDLSSLPPLVPRPEMPSFAAAPAAAAPAAPGGEPSSAAAQGPEVGEKRERGERGRGGRLKKAKEEEARGAAAAAPTPLNGALQAQRAQAQDHVRQLQGLGGRDRVWAQRLLECTAQSYGLVQEAVASGGRVDALFQAGERVHSKIGSPTRTILAAAAAAAARGAAAAARRGAAAAGKGAAAGAAGGAAADMVAEYSGGLHDQKGTAVATRPLTRRSARPARRSIARTCGWR